MRPIDSLLDVMTRLRAPGGCPWDREQTFQSLRPYLLEEAYELAQAIDDGDPESLREELGDLLLQVVFHAQLASELGWFDFEAVAATISAKLVRRHPHVFGDTPAGSVDEAWRRWDAIKADEKAARGEAAFTSRLDGVPTAMPALARAHALAGKAARAGFDWPSPIAVCDKLEEETLEIRAAIASQSREAIAEEIGDLLFATASLARKLDLDPEGCLARANRKFTDRFQRIEQALEREGQAMETVSARELDRRWRENR